MTAAMATMAIKLSGATETSNGIGNETGSDAQEGAVRATEVSATIKAFRCMSLLHSVKRIYRLKRLGDVPNHDVGSHPKSRGGMPATKGLVFIISKILVCFYLAQRNKIATSRDSQLSRVGANQRTKDGSRLAASDSRGGGLCFLIRIDSEEGPTKAGAPA